MGEIGKDHLLKPGGLFRDGLGHHRMAMAMQGDPPAADGIDQGLTLLTDQQGTVSPETTRWAVGCAGHLCERRPQVGVARSISRCAHGIQLSCCHIESGAAELPQWP